MSENLSRYQKSRAKRVEKVEHLENLANNPGATWLLKKFIALEIWRERPRAFEDRMDERTQRMKAHGEELNRRSDERIAAAVGKLNRVRAGEPENIPESQEVSAFSAEQRVAAEQQAQQELHQDPDQQ